MAVLAESLRLVYNNTNRYFKRHSCEKVIFREEEDWQGKKELKECMAESIRTH